MLELSAALVAECVGRDGLTLAGEPFPLSYTDDTLTSLLQSRNAQAR